MESVEWQFYHKTELKDRCGHVTRSRVTTLHFLSPSENLLEPIYVLLLLSYCLIV